MEREDVYVSKVLRELTRRVAVLTLNRPKALNAWDTSMQQEVRTQIAALTEDSDVDAIVLTGAGDAFCAGQDLQETANFTTDQVDSWLDGFVELYDAVLSSPKPVVAALNGVAAGSGYQVALICDVRVAHPGVRIGQPEVSSGIPSITGLYLTWQSLGHSRTTELMLSGRLMDAAEAERLGLVHHVVPADDVLSKAIEVAEQLAAQPAMALQLTKQRIRDVLWPGLADGFATAREVDRLAWGSGEPQATAREFFAKRRERRAAAKS